MQDAKNYEVTNLQPQERSALGSLAYMFPRGTPDIQDLTFLRHCYS